MVYACARSFIFLKPHYHALLVANAPQALLLDKEERGGGDLLLFLLRCHFLRCLEELSSLITMKENLSTKEEKSFFLLLLDKGDGGGGLCLLLLQYHGGVLGFGGPGWAICKEVGGRFRDVCEGGGVVRVQGGRGVRVHWQLVSATVGGVCQEETLVSVCLRLGCVCRLPCSLAVPHRLCIERDQEDKCARPGHNEPARLDNKATCRDVARSAHGSSMRPLTAVWRVMTEEERKRYLPH